ncbi:MAG: rubrerythrin family protein [Asgard group archaeon]|nr:rubrerythrin family protein [Asgard group archaeon]
MDKKEITSLLALQKEKITSYYLYNKLSSRTKDTNNKEIFNKIATNEMSYYEIFKKYTKSDVKPSKFLISFYSAITFVFGFTFSLKLIQKLIVKIEYSHIKSIQNHSEIEKIIQNENDREKLLLNMIDEKRLHYISSIVLGLNDSLVEISAALAGFTFAIQVSHTIALMGLISGSAASLSIAASEYFSRREETSRKEALRSSIYTGVSYAAVVVLLILPYFFISNVYLNLGILFAIVLIVIFLFNFYISIAKDQSFKRRFFEMVLISLSIALISFGIGFIVRKYLGLQI